MYYLDCPPDVRKVSGESNTVLTETTEGWEPWKGKPWSLLKESVKLLLLVDPKESENESESENELPELKDELPEELNEPEDEGELKASSVKKGFGSGGGSAR